MLMDDLSSIVRHSRTFCEHKCKNFNIGFPEQVILMFLSQKKRASQEEVAKHFMIDKGAIAKTVSKLLEKDFIIREENPNDKREKIIYLSNKGNDLIGYMKKVLDEWNEYYFKGLTENEIKEFKRVSEILALNVSDIIKSQKMN